MSRLRPLLSFPALLSTLALTVLLAGCGGAASTSADEVQTSPAGEAATTQETESQPSAGSEDRQEAPDIEGTTLTGERVSLADFRGKPVFLKVWASW